ncbi:hypothetical protein [Luteimonas sp. e5]
MVAGLALCACGGPVDATAPATPVPASTPAAMPPTQWSVPGVLVPQAEAITRFDLKSRLQTYRSPYFRPDERVKIRHVAGDLHLDGPLLLDWDGNLDAHGLVVDGDLIVDGPIVNANMDGGPFLLVGGTTRASAIVGGGAELAFEGDADVDEIVIGHYNGGILVFGKALTTPAVVNMDHHLDVRGPLHGRWFDVFSGDDEWSTFLDMTLPGMENMLEDAWQGLDEALIPRLLQRQRVLRTDLPPIANHPKP